MIEFESVSFTYEAVKRSRRKGRSGSAEMPPADWGRSPDDRWALADLSFRLEDGELFGIAGHTGSGKSTLIQLANGLLQPTYGTVYANGHNLADKKAANEARRDVGVVFQYPERQLFAATVYEDVAFGPRNLGLSAEEVDARVREGLAMVHLDVDALGSRNPFALSGGQQRRVAFAGVLAMRPTTLILDEPVAGLDPKAKRSFLDLVVELHREQWLTVAIVSHNMDDLAQLCDRILVLNNGHMHALGTPDEVFADEAGMRAIGLGVPQAVSLANNLAKRGVTLAQPDGLPTLDSLADAIALRYRQAEAE
ncbi:MAG: energy-coupling factor transporter ATPase [Coriobacteriaceae bacterium]|nr:energy-coupling factor transporter ATPase [Coriobacteriaceae bacterium]